MAKHQYLVGEWTNVEGFDYTLTIYKEDSSDPGSDVITMASPPAVIETEPLGDEAIYNRIWTTKLTASFIVDSSAIQTKLDEILTAQEDTFFVELYKDTGGPELVFQGVSVPDLSEQPSKTTDAKYEASLVFSCGISELMTRPITATFLNDNNLRFWDTNVTFAFLLYTALNQFDFDGTQEGAFSLKTCFRLWHDNMLTYNAAATDRDPLQQMTRVTQGLMYVYGGSNATDEDKERTFGDLLTELTELCGCQLFYSKGSYWFIDPSERLNLNMPISTYTDGFTPDGTAPYDYESGGNATFGVNTLHTFQIPTSGDGRIQTGAYFSRAPAYRKIIQNADFKYRTNSWSIIAGGPYWATTLNTGTPSLYYNRAFHKIGRFVEDYYSQVTIEGTLMFSPAGGSFGGGGANNYKWVARIYVSQPGGGVETPANTYDADGTWKSGGYIEVNLGNLQVTYNQQAQNTLKWEARVPLSFSVDNLPASGDYRMTIIPLCYDFAGNFAGGVENITGLSYPGSPVVVRTTELQAGRWIANDNTAGDEGQVTYEVDNDTYTNSTAVLELADIKTITKDDSTVYIPDQGLLKIHGPDGSGNIFLQNGGDIDQADAQWGVAVVGSNTGKLWELRMERLMDLIGAPRRTQECQFRGDNHFYERLSYDSSVWQWTRYSWELWTETVSGLMEELASSGSSTSSTHTDNIVPLPMTKRDTGEHTETVIHTETIALTDGDHLISGGAMTTLNTRDTTATKLNDGDTIFVYFPQGGQRQEFTINGNWNGESNITISSDTPAFNIPDGTPIIYKPQSLVKDFKALTDFATYSSAGSLGTEAFKRLTATGSYTHAGSGDMPNPETIWNESGGVITLNRDGSDTFYGAGVSGLTSLTLNDGDSVTLYNSTTNVIKIV